jgi:hypothetical protein
LLETMTEELAAQIEEDPELFVGNFEGDEVSF